MAITGEELEKYYIKKITIQDIKCECKNKEEVLKAINRAIDTANAIALAITGEDVAKKILEIQNNAEKTIDTRYPGMIGIFPKALTDVYFRLLEIAFSYAKDSLDQFSNKYLKLWTSTSFKGLTPQLINDTAKTLEKTHSRSIESYTKQLEKDSKSIVDEIIQKYMNDFDKTIDRKLKQIQAKINNEIKLLESWVSVWNPGGSFSNILDALKELLKITKSDKGALSQKQIASLDDLLQELTRKGNTRGYMQTIPENTAAIKGIKDQETKRIVISYMNMVTEDSTERQNFAKLYIEGKFKSAIKSNIKLLENLKKQLISVAEKSARDASVATNLINLCGAVTRLINIISPQPMKGKLDKNDITLIKQLILCTYKNYKFTNNIPEIDLPCLKDMPTKCLMLDIIKLVENGKLSFSASNLNLIVVNYLNRLNNSNSKVIKHAKEMNFITKKDLKIGIFNMPSTKKKLAEEINQQIYRFDKFIKEQKAKIIEQRDEKTGQLSVMEKYKGNPIVKKVENTEFKKFAKDMQQYISKLKDAFKTRYLNKWIKNKKAFEDDCKVVKDGLCKWEQDLINDFEPTFVDQFLSNLESEIKKSAKDELCSIAKEVSSKIKPYKEICLDMFDFIASNVNPGYYSQEKRNAILDFLNWIETQAKSNFGVNPSLFEEQNKVTKYDLYCLLSGISVFDLENLYQKEDFDMPNFFQYCCSTGASSTTIALLMFLQSQVSSSPIPNRNVEFEKPCKSINETLSKYLKSIANNQTTCQTWENYGKNEKFKKLFNGFIDALENDKPISSDTATLMEFFIDDDFNVENDYDVPEFISKSLHNKNTRKVILGMKQLYSKRRSTSAQAVLEDLARNIDANAEKHRESLEKFLGIDKSKTQEEQEQEQEQPQKQPNQNKSTTQKPKQAPTAKPKNKGAGPFVPHQNTRPAAARNRRKK